MIMKMHSYMYVNGYLSFVARDLKKILQSLEKKADRVGGWEKAMATAKVHQAELDAATQRTDSGTDTPDGYRTPIAIEAVSKAHVDASPASILRQRLKAVDDVSVQEMSRSSSPAPPKPSALTPHTLVDHPDQELASLAKEYSELEAELVSNGKEHIRWPENIGWRNFAVYQLIPTLVYELEFPRTDR